MRKTIYTFLLITAMVILHACDVISEDERYIQTDELKFTNKIVLLEDFTGHKCVNCPAAANYMEELRELSEGHLLIVSIHSGVYANTSGSMWKNDFRTEEGNIYHDHFMPEAYPSAMIDRSKNGSQLTISNTALYKVKLIERLSQTSPIDLQLSVTGNEAAGYEVKTEIHFLEDIAGPLALQLWITEDNITSPQLMADNSINENYIHRHVFRQAINGVWGEELNKGHHANEVLEITHPFNYHSDWVKENCSLIAFIYVKSSGEILQAVQL